MKKINFKEFGLYTDIRKLRKEILDVREVFANILYCRMNGIQAHSLAFMIYKSEGVLEITDDEAAIIASVAGQYCTPAFIDGINEQMENQSKTE
ncbi:MAG: hypothetical protein LBC40_04040 [Dysgonamonadaceae bacterium]|jgi:hypothetical protein|nr:hypothetical protein [Dysgonamonadaceae bacterium]